MSRVCASCNGSVFRSFEGMYCLHLQVNLRIQVDALVIRKKKCWLYRTIGGCLFFTTHQHLF